MFHQLIHNPNIQTFVSLCPNNFKSSILHWCFFLWDQISRFFFCLVPTEQNKVVSSTNRIHLSSLDTNKNIHIWNKEFCPEGWPLRTVTVILFQRVETTTLEPQFHHQRAAESTKEDAQQSWSGCCISCELWPSGGHSTGRRKEFGQFPAQFPTIELCCCCR